MAFLPAEFVVLIVVAALAVVNAFLLYVKSISVDVMGYTIAVSIGVLTIAVGSYYRHVRDEARIALAAIASGTFVLFTIVGSLFNYMFLPIVFEPIDGLLFRFDALFGYHWPHMVEWAANHPWVGVLSHLVYFTSLPQLLCIILVLGFTGQEKALHRFLLTGVFGALLSIGFWIFFPTFGAKAYYALPESVLNEIPLAVDPAYGLELVRLGREGVSYVSPRNMLGLIGFPSFHIVMASMSVYFIPRRWLLLSVVLLLNVLMVPAVLIQGGHHLCDVFGGMATFGVALTLANMTTRLLRNAETAPVQEARALAG